MADTQNSPAAVKAGRERIAKLADAGGEAVFAREVRDGCWDHRRDVAEAIATAAQQRRLAAWADEVERVGPKTSIYYRLIPQIDAARAAIAKDA